ncbi:GNAT family N-acetyltransferase [Paenibacillus sp. J2TS4]|uniref:GNAT family N-acetyltransferase n=1 Tax=Paenibacillus sp. J2TS4 TaxID=2807194 RepID=UPI001B27CD5A|nr:GNAT family N-acetyltransferase [Paenibacillus sp. J2TS4]GIP33419.1 hypothetical protein J2TS4_26290 [Paenibacillus sp. J2TS4]
MYSYMKRCESDEDFAQFTLFLIRHSTEFHSRFSFAEALEHFLGIINNCRILLAMDRHNQLIGWVNYWYATADYEFDPHGELAFIDSVIINKEYRSGRVFLKGFQDMICLIAEENRQVKTVQFHALADNAYLNRLYSKFAHIVGSSEGYFGSENVYSTDFDQLLQYLKER